MSHTLDNWAGNHSFTAERVHRPTSAEEVQEIVSRAEKVKAAGTRHSFHDIADTSGDVISTENLKQVLDIDPVSRTVRIQAGLRYGDLARVLAGHGLAIANFASLPHISVAGACATATHGSGLKNQCLSASVSAIEFVAADGSLIKLDRTSEEFNGAVVNLGALGVATALTLDVVPAFDVKQEVFEGLPVDYAIENLEAVMSAAYSVSLFTDWRTDRINQVWTKSLGPESLGRDFHGAVAATVNRHPILHIDPVNCTPQLGELGPSAERLPHFRFEYTPSAGEELQAEYLVPLEQAPQVLQEVRALRGQIVPVLRISEIRAINQDDLWMSPFYGQPCIGVHFTLIKDWEAVRPVLSAVESRLQPLGARPHWGKLCAMAPAHILANYSKLNDFLGLVRRYDPDGKFQNRFLGRLFNES